MRPRRLRYGARGLVYQLASLLLLGLAAQASAAPRLVWALGDSLTAGYGLPPDRGLTAHLQGALQRGGMDVEVRNGGVSGDTSAQGRARVLWGLRGLRRTPDLVLVELGANDMLRGLPPTQAEANLAAILELFRQRRIPVLLLGMRAAPNLGADYRSRFDAIYPRLAQRYRVPLYPFFLVGVAGRRALIQADGLHPNAAGVATIVTRLAPAVARALREGGR